MSCSRPSLLEIIPTSSSRDRGMPLTSLYDIGVGSQFVNYYYPLLMIYSHIAVVSFIISTCNGQATKAGLLKVVADFSENTDKYTPNERGRAVLPSF